MSQWTEIFVVKRHKVQLEKMQVMICYHTNCNMAEVTCFNAMLIIFSEI